MYSKNNRYRMPGEAVPVPPHYSGVRFRRDARVAPPEEKVQEAPAAEALDEVKEKAEDEVKAVVAEIKDEKKGLINKLSGIFGNVGEDDILLAALIIILAGEGREDNRDAMLLLILLLCIR